MITRRNSGGKYVKSGKRYTVSGSGGQGRGQALLEAEDAGYIYTDFSLEEEKTRKKQKIASARYQAEHAGIVVEGVPVRTNLRTRTIVTAARARADKDVDNFVFENWKLGNGMFVDISGPQVIAIDEAIVAHVESVFAHEKELNDQINAATTVEEVALIVW